MTFLQGYVLFGIPLVLLAVAIAALLWYRWEDHRERQRHVPGE